MDNRNVRCDGCGCAFEPEPEVLAEDGLEYTYFSCPFCGRKYPISVTGPALRRKIRALSLLAARHRKKRLPERTLRRMQRERAAVHKRTMELRREHPMGGAVAGDVPVDRPAQADAEDVESRPKDVAEAEELAEVKEKEGKEGTDDAGTGKG